MCINPQKYAAAFIVNDNLTFFSISLRDKSSLKTINATETSLELSDLDYNVDYSAYVTASTRFGDGKTRSSIINFRTPEGGEFSRSWSICRVFSSKGIRYENALVSLKPILSWMQNCVCFLCVCCWDMNIICLCFKFSFVKVETVFDITGSTEEEGVSVHGGI